MAQAQAGGEEAFDYTRFTIPALCDAKRSPRYLDGRVCDDWLEDYFLNCEDGGISHIVTRHGVIAVDLFVDYTDFRGLLINQALDEPFISCNDSLHNDRAVANAVPDRHPLRLLHRVPLQGGG